MTAAQQVRKNPIGFLIALVLIVSLPFLGNGGLLASALVAVALLGAPLFVLIGVLTVLSYVLWADVGDIIDRGTLIERIRTLSDSPTLLAIPLFIMSGTVMSKGQISVRLVEWAKALVGWIPGGLAMSAVLACILFAAISGSSPATVVAIGAMMGPNLIKAGYNERFSHGLLTSAGSLGILIPPSIPMIIYPIVNQGTLIQVEHLFAAGFGPGLLMGAILMVYCGFQGAKGNIPTTPFSGHALWTATRDGFWALMFPVLILGGIYSGIFNAVEAAGVSVVYAVLVEVYLHRAITLRGVPAIFQETGIFLGSLLVIMVAALTFSEFLETEGIPHAMVEWLRQFDLAPWQFLLVLNVLLLIVGMAMDILSAMFIFVPLLAPIAAEMGVDPIHFGIIFIVNLEIGYLTPPVGLNLFFASALFEKPIGHIIRSVIPFVGVMLIGLMLVTYQPALSVGFGNWIMGVEPTPQTTSTITGSGGLLGDEQDEDQDESDDEERDISSIQAELEELRGSGVLNMQQMMREAELQQELEDRAAAIRTQLEELRGAGVLNMQQMMQEAELQGQLDALESESEGNP